MLIGCTPAQTLSNAVQGILMVALRTSQCDYTHIPHACCGPDLVNEDHVVRLIPTIHILLQGQILCDSEWSLFVEHSQLAGTARPACDAPDKGLLAWPVPFRHTVARRDSAPHTCHPQRERLCSSILGRLKEEVEHVRVICPIELHKEEGIVPFNIHRSSIGIYQAAPCNTAVNGTLECMLLVL